jgi:hypothetical protein
MNRPDTDHPVDEDVFAPAAIDPEAPLDDVDGFMSASGGFEANEADALEQAQLVTVDDDDESAGYT